MTLRSGPSAEAWWLRPAGAMSLVAMLLATAMALQVTRDRVYASETIEAQTLRIRSGEVLGRMALSFDALLADVYWMRALQQYGGTRRSNDPHKRYDLLYPLLDVTTTLDPRFNVAYRFGAIFLTEAYPNGPGRPDQAIALLQKGVAAMPDRWQYLMDIGFIHYWWLNDYPEAARWFRRAAAIDGSPWWLQSLAANTLAEGGDRRGARMLWTQQLETADDTWLRGEALRRLMQLDALDQLDGLTARLGSFTEQQGRFPRSWGELGFAMRPVDPSGHPYVLDPASRRIVLSADSLLLPLPAPTGGPRP